MPVDFRDSFWGEKNSGFNFLYHNMKYGYVATKELADFFRERSLIEENHSKLLAKLAKQAGNGCSQGTFAPLWQVLKASSEKLSSLHAQMVVRFQDLVKEVHKYSDEQHKKHKQVKEEESGTSEIVQLIQQTTATLQKAREAYNMRCLECERLRRDNASPKDLEKVEAKCKKACDDYKSYVEKYNAIREDFEEKMMVSCQHFQQIEESHLKQMKDFLFGYSQVLDSGHALIGQVHIEFRQQCDDMDIDNLLEQFVNSKETGTDKPSYATFEEADLSSLAKIASSDSVECNNGEKVVKKEGFLKSKREKRKEKKKKRKDPVKEDASSTSSEKVKTNDELVPHDAVTVDAEGFTIKPVEETREIETFYSSSGSDSDDVEKECKIHIEIKPLTNGAPMSASVDEIRDTIRTITLSPINQHPNRRNYSATSTPDEGPLKRSISASQPLSKGDSDVFSIFSPMTSAASTPTGGPEAMSSPLSVGNTSTVPSMDTTPTMGDRYAALSELFAEAAQSEMNSEFTKVPMNGSRGSMPTAPPLIPRPPSRRGIEVSSRGRMSPLPATMSRAESIGSLTSDFRTISMPVGSSRGPSPLTIGMCDTIPLAVAFQEVVHAYFKGTDESKCQVRLMGDMKVSFPSGIVQVLTSNPQPAALAFRIVRASKMENILPNRQLISQDTCNIPSDEYLYEFNMPALTTLLRKQYEATPNASHFNIDILKYHIKSSPGAKSTPLHLVAYWKCDRTTTNLRIDFKYNPGALSTMAPITNISILVPVDGGVVDMQSMPSGVWNADNQRAMWRISELSHHSEAGGVGSLRAKFNLNNGPSTPTTLAAQFVCLGSSLSGADFELVGLGYRLSLVKKQVSAGKYLCEADRNMNYA